MPGRPASAWGKALTARVGRQVAAYREARDLTGRQLSERTRERGLEIKAPVLSTIETGTRDSISLAEILVLAAALDVPPITLIFAIGRDNDVEVLPGDTVRMYEAYQWFVGEWPLHKSWEGPRPEHEVAFHHAANPIPYLRMHDRALFEAFPGDDEDAVRRLRDLRHVMATSGQVLPPVPSPLNDRLRALEGSDG